VSSKKGNLYDFAYDCRVAEIEVENKHHVDDMAHIARSAKLKLPDLLPYTHLDSDSSKLSNCLAICPDVKRKESCYPVDKYAKVIQELLESDDVNQVILFTENENSPYRELEQYGARWCPTRNVEEFIKEVSKCRWAISSEGGSAHIVGALGLGVIVLSGMGHQTYWRPYAEFVSVLERKQAVDEIETYAVISAFRNLKAQMGCQV